VLGCLLLLQLSIAAMGESFIPFYASLHLAPIGIGFHPVASPSEECSAGAYMVTSNDLPA
jgi:hypothetical protein